MKARLRTIAAVIALTLGVTLVPLSATGWWVRDEVTDTDTFVATVGPLASDQTVLALVERRVVAQVMGFIDDQHLLSDAVAALVSQGMPETAADALTLLAGPLRVQTEQLVTTIVHRVITSPDFATAWSLSLTSLHQDLLNLASGKSELVTIDTDGTVDLSLASVGNAIRLELVNAGVPGADRLPELDVSVPIANADQLQAIQRVYELLTRSTLLLVLASIVLLATGILVARRRSRAARIAALSVLVALLLTLVGLGLGREAAVDALPQSGQDAGQAILTILTDPLRHLLRSLALLTILVLITLPFLGPGPAALALRQRVARGPTAIMATAQRWRYTPYTAGGIAALLILALLIGDFSGSTMELLLAGAAVAAGLAVLTHRVPTEA